MDELIYWLLINSSDDNCESTNDTDDSSDNSEEE